jgi:hypothetical protein
VRRALFVPLLALVVTACSSDTTVSGEAPSCSGSDRPAGNGVLLIAQSVPTSSWVPCLRTGVPSGWTFAGLDARNGRSRLSLDSDRDGVGAIEVLLEPTCNTSGATEIPSDREGMRRWERVKEVSPHYVGSRYYVFDGGCLTFDFRLGGDSHGEALALASQLVGAAPRDELRAQVRADSDGRLSLDPAEDGAGPP